MAWQKVTIPIPEDLGPSERESLGKDIVEFIRQRTESGTGIKETARGVKNVSFPAYSKTYIDSLDFKIAGKSKNKVNLTLSGDMLIALDVLSTRKGEVTIGFQPGSEENDRAEGNILGSYGGSPNPKKARNFLGIAPEDLDALLQNYQAEK